MQPQDYKYWAFISYSHQDRAWGNWLHRSLETYRLPRRLVGREHWCGPLPRRLAPVFRDRDELPSSADLSSVINQALLDSRYLIVICSPQSASSRWVNEEIKHFKALGRADRVLPLIIGGEPNASDRPESGLAECLPPAVRFDVSADGELTDRRTEPIAADARGGKDGRADALLKIIAGMISVGFDELKQRERHRVFWQRVTIALAVAALVMAAQVGWRWQQAEKRRALETLSLKNRIATLYENGRQELLAHNEARAAVYLNEVYKLGVDTPALRFMLGRAMRVVDAQKIRIQTGSAVILTDVSTDGAKLLTIGQDLRLRIWDTTTGEKVQEWAIGDSPYFSARFSQDGKSVWLDSRDANSTQRRLRVFNSASGGLLAEYLPGAQTSESVPVPMDHLGKHVIYIRPDRSIAVASLRGGELRIPGRYSTVAFCGDSHSVIAGSDEGRVKVFDSTTGRLIRGFDGLDQPVTVVDSSEHCNAIGAGTSAGTLRVWETASGKLRMAGGHAGPLIDLRLSVDGSRLASLARNGVEIWDGHSGVLIYSSRFQNPNGVLATLSPNGRRLATTIGSRVVMVDPETAAETFSMDAHQGTPTAFSFSPDSRRLVTGGPDGVAVVWDLPTDALSEQKHANGNIGMAADAPETAVAFNSQGSEYLVGSTDGRATLWDSRSLLPKLISHAHNGPVSAIAFAPRDDLVATGSWDRSVRLWNTHAPATDRLLEKLNGRIWSLAFNVDGTRLSAAVEGGITRVWNVAAGRPMGNFEQDSQMAQAFSSDGMAFAVGSHGRVHLWDFERNRDRWSIPLSNAMAAGASVGLVAFSPDGSSVLVTLLQQRLFILDATTGKILHAATASGASGLYVGGFSPDGRNVVVGDSGNAVVTWEPASGTLRTLEGHTAQVTSAGYSPDGAFIVSGASDGFFKIWDADRYELLLSQPAHTGGIGWGQIRYSQDGRRLLTGGTDGAARLWDVGGIRETPGQIAASLDCHVAWQLQSTSLITGAPSCDTPTPP